MLSTFRPEIIILGIAKDDHHWFCFLYCFEFILTGNQDFTAQILINFAVFCHPIEITVRITNRKINASPTSHLKF